MKALFYKGEDVTLTFSSTASLAGYMTKAVKFFTPFSTIKTAALTTPDNNTIVAKLSASDTADLPSGTLNIVIELTASSGKVISKTIEAKLADAYIDGSERDETDLTTEIIFLQNQPIKVNFSLSGVQYDEIIAASNTAVTAKDTAVAASSSAQSSATNSQNSATSAQNSAGAAQSSENNAQSYAIAAQSARDASIVAKTGSETARDESVAARNAAQLIANSMIEGKGYKGLTSTTSTLIGTGTKTFTTNLDLSATAFSVGARVRVANPASPANFMEGVITTYSANSLTVNVDLIGGSGTFASWNFSIAGQNAILAGTGATNYLTKWTSESAVGISQIFDNGTNVGIGTVSPTGKFEIRGNRLATKDLLLNLSKLDFGTTNFYQNYSNTFYANGKSLEVELDGLPMLQLAINNIGTASKVIFPNGNVGFGVSNPTALIDINSNTLRLRTAKTPGTSTATGNQGDICWDSGYLYVCVASNTWKRAALATW
jgi:hypothetical protein